jgi:hypothetical protein
MRTVTAICYLTPLREGGSLPALVEGDDHQRYVLKFRGAGQGPKALIAELIAGEILRVLGLPVPELVLVEVDAALGRSERDPEIQDLLLASTGLNLALAYLPEALPFDPLLLPPPAPDLASAVVWADAYLTNVDRTPRNPNLLLIDEQLWLIDHGAALYMHHNWKGYQERSRSRFPQVKDHVLLPFASQLAQADAELSMRLTHEQLRTVVNLVPESWLTYREDGFATAQEQRDAYLTYLSTRLEAPRAFVEDASNAHIRCV